MRASRTTVLITGDGAAAGLPPPVRAVEEHGQRDPREAAAIEAEVGTGRGRGRREAYAGGEEHDDHERQGHPPAVEHARWRATSTGLIPNR